MKSRIWTAFSLVAALAATAPIPSIASAAESGGNAQAGRDVALRSCTGCHDVAADQRFKPVYPRPLPDFKTIANKSNTTTASVRQFLEKLPAVPKPGQMANPLLSSQDVRDVAAYIVSLRDGSMHEAAQPPAR